MGGSQSNLATACSCPELCSTDTDVVMKLDKKKHESRTAGIGAVFSVDSNGCVFFDGTAAGSSCADAMEQKLIQRGDILVAVEGIPVRQSTLGKISQQLLGPPNSFVQLTIRRDGRLTNLHLERRRTDKLAMERAMEEAYERAKNSSQYAPSDASTLSSGGPSPRRNGVSNGASPAQVKATTPLVGPAAQLKGGVADQSGTPGRGGPSSSVWA